MQKTKLSFLLSVALTSAAFASSAELQDIIVTTPTKSPLSLQSVTSNIDVITSEDIEERGFLTLGDLLKSRPGIQMNRNGGLGKSTSLYLRGMDSKRTLVLVDGVRYNDPTSLSGAQFAHLLLDDVARIEIVKGPQSGIWGADASAGVINIITKKAQKEGLSTVVGAEYGSYNTQKYSLNTAYKQNMFDIAFGFERVDTDGFSSKVPEGADVDDFEDDGYTNNTSNLRVGLNVTENDRVEAFFNYIDADSDYDGYNKDPIAAANDAGSSVKSKEKFYGLSYTHAIDKDSFKLYANRSDFSREYSKGFTKDYDGSVDEAGFNAVVNYMKDAVLTAGLDYKKFSHENKIDSDYTNQGISLTNTNTFDALISGKTIFSQSLRYDKYDAFDNRFTYKVGLKHIHENIKDFWTAVNYATGYNVPTLYQLYDGYAGNENLKPEKTKGFDITANYKGFGVTYFQTTIEDLIDYVTTDFVTFAGEYQNLSGESTFKGVEVSYDGALESIDLAYGVNYTYLKTEDNDGKELPRRAKDSANLSLDYYGLANTHLGALIEYVGKRKKSKYDKNTAVDYKSYTVVDLNADYTWNKAVTFYVRVENALDKKYQNITGYATAERSFYAGFRYKIQ
jgi:vitamin B12 transporter